MKKEDCTEQLDIDKILDEAELGMAKSERLFRESDFSIKVNETLDDLDFIKKNRKLFEKFPQLEKFYFTKKEIKEIIKFGLYDKFLKLDEIDEAYERCSRETWKIPSEGEIKKFYLKRVWEKLPSLKEYR